MTKPLFDVFRSAMMDNADGSRKEAMDDFVKRMKSNRDYVEMLAKDYFERMAAVWTVRTDGKNRKTFSRTGVSQDRAERMSGPRGADKPLALVRQQREESAARSEAIYQEKKMKLRNIILLDIVMPNGKLLRNATGADCKKAGGFYGEIAKHLKPTQVVDRNMTENDLQNIRARYFQANKAA